MVIDQQDEKDISKVFTFVRAQLQAKEKELLELQQADPCLLPPDSEQIDTLLDAIASLQLSTQEGSFVFASASDEEDTPSYTSDCSTGFDSIKTLPANVWLSPSSFVNQQQNEQQQKEQQRKEEQQKEEQRQEQQRKEEQQKEEQRKEEQRKEEQRKEQQRKEEEQQKEEQRKEQQRKEEEQKEEQQPSIFSHVLSLPMNNYLSSSCPSTFQTNVKTQNQSLHRIPVVNHILCMPINAFKSPSPNACTSMEIKNNKNLQMNVLPTTGSSKSVVDHGMIYSKELWLQNSQNTSYKYEASCSA
jgi:flagellar biosynthesis GTPase FlhF